MKKANWAKGAYRDTDIHWSKSQGKIHQMLGDLGIYEIRFTNLKDKFVLEFLAQVNENEKPRAVRIGLPLQNNTDDERKRERELNIVHRILFNHLKAKFVSIQCGLMEFEQEFMAHLVIQDGKGNSRTMGEMLLPEYKKR